MRFVAFSSEQHRDTSRPEELNVPGECRVRRLCRVQKRQGDHREPQTDAFGDETQRESVRHPSAHLLSVLKLAPPT
jgi:hypothetical protein